MYDIAIIGNYTKDTIKSPAGRRTVDGGGFNYGAHVAAMMGLRTAAVTRLAHEDAHVLEALARLGVDVFAEYTDQSTCLRLCYPTQDPDERVLTMTSWAGAFTPEQVRHIDARAFLLNGSSRGEIGVDVIHVLRAKGGLLAADAQAFARTVGPDGVLGYEEWPEKEDMLALFDVVKADSVEAEMLTGWSDLRAAARVLQRWGPQEVVLTSRDGVLALAGSHFYEAAFSPRNLVGRSGRGDTCIAAYVGKRLSAEPAEATSWAAVVTSMKLEAEGPLRAAREEVEARFASPG